MNWLKRAKRGIKTWRKKSLPDGLWLKCPSCGMILYRKELKKSLSVCQKCSYHFRIGSSEYIEILSDKNSFTEINPSLKSEDPLGFKDSKKYTSRLKSAVKKSGMNSAIKTGVAAMEGHSFAIGVLDFSFMGGSMGSVVGEKIARLVDVALDRKIPLVMVSSSGGARMQESILSLMQMAKTSAAISKISRASLPYISVLTNPTTGGVAASFAFQGDLIIAEPKALIGFAGPRVIKETVGEELPKGFQTSEFLLEHGMIDMICGRGKLKSVLSFALDSLMHKAASDIVEDRQDDIEKISFIQQ